MTTNIGQQIADLERRVRRMERASRLGSASLDGTALQVLDPSTGGLRGIVGVQPDGTTAVTVVNGAAPPAPSTPTVAPALGGIAVTWDGALAGGAVLPLDWSRVEVHTSATDGFTPDATTLQATIETPQGATVYVPATAAQYVVLLARNTSGTASDPSGQAGPYEPRQVVGADVADGSITETQIADNAVTTPKIKAGAVEADQLAANSVTTPALAAGSVDAVALKADAITGKTITGGIITGATVQTSGTGHRIVLDDADGAVKVYNDDGNPTNYIGGPDNILWNLEGWEADGTPDGEFVGMWLGNLLLGAGNPGTLELANTGLIGNLAGIGISFQSPSEPSGSGGYEDNAFARLMAGVASSSDGSSTGTVDAPVLQLERGTDLAVSGNAVKLTSTENGSASRYEPETWQTPAFNTGWASASSSGVYQGLQFRHDIEDNVVLVGVVHATAAAPGSQVFTLPAGYRPKVNQRAALDTFAAAGSSSTANASLIVNTSGVVQIFCSAAIASGQNFGVYARLPLGNLP